jgi:hypothetical protein
LLSLAPSNADAPSRRRDAVFDLSELIDFAMTGYTVHTGSSEKFASGWDQIFKKSKQSGSGKPQTKAAAAKKPPKGKQRGSSSK